MRTFIGRRLAQAVLVVFGVSVVVFFVIRLSGDPTYLMLPPNATDEDRVRFARELGLDRPLPVQYGVFIRHAVAGDFGRSLRYNQPALGLVLERLPATLELAAAALVVSLAVAIPAGVVSAVRRNTAVDILTMLGALFGQSMPVFWLGILMILIFSVRLDMFPTSGRGTFAHLVLPAVTLGLYSTARVTRLVRAGMLEVISQDYVRTAWAKGLAARVVIYKHALRNTLIPVVTIVGLELGTLLGGAVITETVFAWPGVGRLAVTAIFQRDYPVVQAAVCITAIVFLLSNLLVDMIYGWLDPRIRVTA
jgi:ABC-type dipeptide/oligopeptide/nickel transport system permease component